MTTPGNPNGNRELNDHTPLTPAAPPSARVDELDALLPASSGQPGEANAVEVADTEGPDPIEALRRLTINALVPTFVELVEKYAGTGISMKMDASNFLRGGREVRFEFGLHDHRTQLLGTVTAEAIAFHETRYSPNVHGELASGPMLRLRTLTARTFREFICERLTLLLRSAMRRR